jgi:hypothetical protein
MTSYGRVSKRSLAGLGKRESRTRILHAPASMATGWSGFVALDWIRYLSPVAVRMAVEQPQGLNDSLEAKGSPEFIEATAIGCPEARTGEGACVVEVTNARVWRVIPFLDPQWADGADPGLWAKA